MATQSIVEFVRDALSSSAASDRRPTVAQSLVSRTSELVYITYASQVVAALRDKPGLTARELFDHVDSTDFAGFQAALQEMTQRGLLCITGNDPKYGDKIFSLPATHATT
jgi:hypothetical protein